MLQWSLKLGEDASRGGVRKMSVPRENTLLDRPGATGIALQKSFVVVCLDENRANSPKCIKNQAGCITEVRKHAETGPVAGNSKSDGIHSVVRNRECANGKASDPKLRSRLEESPVAMHQTEILKRSPGKQVAKYRHLVTRQHYLQRACLIAMFVGQENA